MATLYKYQTSPEIVDISIGLGGWKVISRIRAPLGYSAHQVLFITQSFN